MKKKIIFYGGCQGIKKTKLLNEAIEKVQEGRSENIPFKLRPVSTYFQDLIHRAKNEDHEQPILWYQEDWKKFDLHVRDKLVKEIRITDVINIINNHFSVLYKGKDNYLPGLELTSLEYLLLKSFCNNGERGSLISGNNAPLFGLLLIDLEPSLVVNYYVSKYEKGNDDILNYISIRKIAKDLEQNRRWAKSYYDTAVLALGVENVYRETIYITKELTVDSYLIIHEKIASFLRKFI